jgi:hypothetical protein
MCFLAHPLSSMLPALRILEGSLQLQKRDGNNKFNYAIFT